MDMQFGYFTRNPSTKYPATLYPREVSCALYEDDNENTSLIPKSRHYHYTIQPPINYKKLTNVDRYKNFRLSLIHGIPWSYSVRDITETKLYNVLSNFKYDLILVNGEQKKQYLVNILSIPEHLVMDLKISFRGISSYCCENHTFIPPKKKCKLRSTKICSKTRLNFIIQKLNSNNKNIGFYE
ncbi:hypothetical protein LbFV_ORF94 [Leptopilina boulardi filamentous virus]|uniref:Uncharacterized protein n=1 Tax=Leptopilina boulardi filamentous virus TaxID=552509 RepID=A0A1S5YDE8_9VIRU|nr:hypothetical protein LbFV_ORF94 [Leptopilina boulardi filamentous virus]AQQ80014.1 hypothetical protein LbFV_ORF94 [Leptopilina boulardi filamentous virus]